MKNYLTSFTISLLALFLCSLSMVYSQTNFWTQINPPVSGDVNAVAINASGHLYAGTGYSGYRSTNDGASWTAMGNVGGGVIKCLCLNSKGDIFVGIEGYGIYFSTTNGAGWSSINSGISDTYVHSITIKANDELYAGMATGGLFRSTTNGSSWTKVNTSTTISYINALVFNTSGHLFVGSGNGGVYRSTDNGANWTQIVPGSFYSGVTSLVFNSSGQLFASTTAGGVFRSADNGSTWTQINSGLTAMNVTKLAISPQGVLFAGTFNAGVFRSLDNGATWTAVSTGLKNMRITSFAFSSTGYLYAASGGGGVHKSTATTTDIRSQSISPPLTFSLEQNFPNPFNPNTCISYQIPDHGFVHLRVTDLLGREVETLLDEYQSPGFHRVSWRPDNLCSGIYFYRLTVNQYFSVRKMIYQK